jgi:NADH dehydrogenase (ubiquinone) 1 alpha subcomplex subunit 5
MRRTFRQLASVKPARYLEAGTQTGLTGVYTHASPRSTLLYLYSSTLDKLKAVPEHSLYRQSVEAVTNHRKALVEAAVPPGYEAWVEKAAAVVNAHPEEFSETSLARVDGAKGFRVEKNGQSFVVRHLPKHEDERYQEWDGEIDEGGELEGPRSAEERAEQRLIAERTDIENVKQIEWEPEPQLTADQWVFYGTGRVVCAVANGVSRIEELENKIGAGLIEEVIQVAEGELKLVDTMVHSKV